MLPANRLGLVLLYLLLAVSACDSATLGLSPVRAAPGRDLLLQVRIEGAAALYGCAFDLVYDPAALQAKSRPAGQLMSYAVSQASFLDEAGTTATFALSALEAATPGRLVVGLTRVGSTPGVSSSEQRTLVTIGMKALAPGNSLLRLERVVFQDGSRNRLPVSTPAAAPVEITSEAVNREPRADAGRDRLVRPGRRVVLDATLSEDPDADTVSYAWRQISGPFVELGDVARPVIPLPPTLAGSPAFEVSVSDGSFTSRAAIVVTVSDLGNTSPRVLATIPTTGTNGVLPVPFTLIDAESDPATVAVAVSLDATTFRTATPVAGAPLLAGLSSEPGGLPYTFLWSSAEDLGAMDVPAVWLRFTASDADQGAATLLGPFPLKNSQVTLGTTVVSPRDGSAHFEQDDLRFQGRAFAPGGSSLSGDALVWVSNLSGEIGRGDSFVRRLPPGYHYITLTAAVGPRLSQSAAVQVFVDYAAASARQQLQLDRGLNIIALPYDPGTTANPYLAADLLRDVSSAFVARTPGALETGAPFVASVDGLALATRPLRGNEGYLIRRDSPGQIDLFAKPWPPEQRTVHLRSGWQWIAIPGPASELTSADLARLTSSPVVVETAQLDPVAGARFHVWMASGAVAPFALRPDRGYGVLCRERRTVFFPGSSKR